MKSYYFHFYNEHHDFMESHWFTSTSADEAWCAASEYAYQYGYADYDMFMIKED